MLLGVGEGGLIVGEGRGVDLTLSSRTSKTPRWGGNRVFKQYFDEGCHLLLFHSLVTLKALKT